MLLMHIRVKAAEIDSILGSLLLPSWDSCNLMLMTIAPYYKMSVSKWMGFITISFIIADLLQQLTCRAGISVLLGIVMKTVFQK